MPQPPVPIRDAAPRADGLGAAAAFRGGAPGLARIARGGDRRAVFRCGPGGLLVSDPSQTARADPPGLAHRGARFRAAGVAIGAEVDRPQAARPTRARDPAGYAVEPAEARIRG